VYNTDSVVVKSTTYESMQVRVLYNGVAEGGERPPPNRHKNHSLKKAKSVEKWRGGGYVTCSKVKLIKYVSTDEKEYTGETWFVKSR
jgi:hypothetical protein